MTDAPFRILVHVTLKTMLRHFESVLLSLAERGHAIRIATHRRPNDPPPAALANHPRIEFISSPGRRGDAWGEPIHELRSLRDYMRYLEPRFENATKLRTRALRKMVQAVTHEELSHLVARCPQCDARLVDDEVGRMLLAFRKTGLKNLDDLFALMEATIPSDDGIEDFLRAERPDVLVATPLINLGSYQADYVKSAKALGIPVVFPVFSWDNLSNKGLIHVAPDRVLVWNEQQRREAVEMHQMAADRVSVIGAPRFDDFFAMTPQQSRGDFCQAHTLDAHQPIVTYLCSSEFVARDERDFVVRWIDELRQSPVLSVCNVLIRPHPREVKQWKDFVPPGPRIAVSRPRAINSDQSLFDTLHYSAAVVGLNTSAQLEAAIAGKPVYTILVPEFSEGQQGTIHFQYLLKEHGGFVGVAADFDQHRRQLAEAVSGRYDAQAIRDFIESFVRPHGFDRPVAPLMADAIERCVPRRTAPHEHLAPVQ